MIANLVAANLSQRPVRTLLSVLLIAVPVTLMLTLVGLSHGFVDDSARRTRGVGADIIVRSPDSHIGTLALNNMPDKLVGRLEQLQHVTQGMGVANHQVSGWLP